MSGGEKKNCPSKKEKMNPDPITPSPTMSRATNNILTSVDEKEDLGWLRQWEEFDPEDIFFENPPPFVQPLGEIVRVSVKFGDSWAMLQEL